MNFPLGICMLPICTSFAGGLTSLIPFGTYTMGKYCLNPLVSYLTLVSDLDLAPNTDQFVASPPVRYISSGCCVKEIPKWTP